MASQTLNRLRTLETAMADMAVAVARTTADVDRTTAAVDRTTAAVDRTAANVDRTTANVDRLSHDMDAFKVEMRADRRELNRRLGEIANHQGRFVEDIVAPSIESVLRRLLALPEGATVAPCGPRLKLLHPHDRTRMRELDVIAAHGGVALVVEVKSQLAPERVAAFAASLPELKEYLAPLAITEILGAVATLYADPSIVAHASRLGLVVLGVGDEMMEPKNPAGFVPKRL